MGGVMEEVWVFVMLPLWSVRKDDSDGVRVVG